MNHSILLGVIFGITFPLVIVAHPDPIEQMTIQNRYLKVTSIDHGIRIERILDLESPETETIIPKLRFVQKVKAVRQYQIKALNWGEGDALIFEHENDWNTEVRLFDSSPFVQLQTTVVNKGKEKYETDVLPLHQYQVDINASLENLKALGTGGLTSIGQAQGSYTFSAIADPETRNGVVSGWLTHEQGVGSYFPGVVDLTVRVKTQLEMGYFQVLPDQERQTDTLLIGYFDDVRLGLESYADSVANHYQIKLKPRPSVYCTWYHAGASKEEDLIANSKFASERLKPYGLTVMQIDDRWQKVLPDDFKPDTDPKSIKLTGPIKVFSSSNQLYPSGMAHSAQKITELGMVPGIWFMPFAGNFRNPYFDNGIFAMNPDGTPFHDDRWSGTCIDLTKPKAEAFVRQRVRRIYDWGYRYFKIDGMHTGMPSYNIYIHKGYKDQKLGKAILHDANQTHAQAYRTGLRILREEAPDTYILGCNVSQNMISMGPAFGMIDAMRIGPDNGAAGRGRWNQVVLGAWHGSNLYFLNNRIWHNDPDPVYVRKSNPLEKARWMVSWLAVTGSMHTSSEQYDKLEQERLDLLKRCLPAHDAQVRPVDYLESNQPQIWLAQDSRMRLIGLFNWEEKQEAQIKYSFKKLGLDPGKSYHSFDFWKNRFSGTISKNLDEALEPGTCRVLALREVVESPVVVSTSRHITQGLIDVEEESWDANTNTFKGKSRVVGGDRYELRIVLPNEGSYLVRRARLGDQVLTMTRMEGDPQESLRVYATPQETGLVEWEIEFE